MSDEKWGEAVEAIVKLKGGHSVRAEELVALCKEKLGSVKSEERGFHRRVAAQPSW
nr:hypothetical protein [Paraburkholderia mimosarum]